MYWSLPFVYTNSVARAYRRPVRGLDGAGDGGRLCPSRSTCGKAFFSTFVVVAAAAVLESATPLEASDPDADIAAAGWGRMAAYKRGGRKEIRGKRRA